MIATAKPLTPHMLRALRLLARDPGAWWLLSDLEVNDFVWLGLVRRGLVETQPDEFGNRPRRITATGRALLGNVV